MIQRLLGEALARVIAFSHSIFLRHRKEVTKGCNNGYFRYRKGATSYRARGVTIGISGTGRR